VTIADDAVGDEAVGDDEASALFNGLEALPGLVLAVSGGSDSTALLVLAARWAKRLKARQRSAPKLLAVTVDHGLRPESAREAAAVKRLAGKFGVAHRTVRWSGAKPRTGLQEAARLARYRLLAQTASHSGCAHILTAHTLDDQAETVLFRLARGSGLVGLGGMARSSPLPISMTGQMLLRPLLHVSKARLIATLKSLRIGHSEDPSNHDPRFTRVRLRTLMPDLAREGLDAPGLARLATRMRRAEVTVAFAVVAARAALAPGPWSRRGPIVFETSQFANLPAEVGLRLLGEAIGHTGSEGPVELGKLETLYDALATARSPLRRTLAGALITLGSQRLTIEPAPARRGSRGRRAPARRSSGMR
jgi:tRNA(Ile)-lysidine synthase